MTNETRPHGPWSPGAIGKAEALAAGDPEWMTVNTSINETHVDAAAAWKAHAERWEQRTVAVEAERDTLIAAILNLADEYSGWTTLADPGVIRDELLCLAGED